MLEIDECNEVLVTDIFADDSSTIPSRNNHDIHVTLTINSSHHPLRSRSVSPARRCNTPNISSAIVAGNEGETQPGLNPLLYFDDRSVVAVEDRTTGEATVDGSKTIIHPVGPNDSFAGVALRYGVSIAALRRANQFWPSDPIHLRTELVIPRGDSFHVRRKPTHGSGMNATLPSTVAATSNFPPDLFASSFVTARNKILSILPARISLDSLSSKASASEDHELDDLHKTRARRMPAIETPFVEDGLEPSILDAPHTQYVPLSQTDSHQCMDLYHLSSVSDVGSRSISSPSTRSLERPHCRQPFAVLPVCTSQLEPEPAMELPVRRPHI